MWIFNYAGNWCPNPPIPPPHPHVVQGSTAVTQLPSILSIQAQRKNSIYIAQWDKWLKPPRLGALTPTPQSATRRVEGIKYLAPPIRKLCTQKVLSALEAVNTISIQKSECVAALTTLHLTCGQASFPSGRMLLPLECKVCARGPAGASLVSDRLCTLLIAPRVIPPGPWGPQALQTLCGSTHPMLEYKDSERRGPSRSTQLQPPFQHRLSVVPGTWGYTLGGQAIAPVLEDPLSLVWALVNTAAWAQQDEVQGPCQGPTGLNLINQVPSNSPSSTPPQPLVEILSLFGLRKRLLFSTVWFMI